MSTHSAIGYEQGDGSFFGVYCHYDGYPDHMVPCLKRMFHADVVIMVNEALKGGGILSIEPGGGYDTFERRGLRSADVAPILEWPSQLEYSYVKLRDGTLLEGTARQGWVAKHGSVVVQGD